MPQNIYDELIHFDVSKLFHMVKYALLKLAIKELQTF